MALVIGLDLVGAVVEAENVDHAPDALVPALVHREGRRARWIEPTHSFLKLGIDPRAARSRLVPVLFVSQATKE